MPKTPAKKKASKKVVRANKPSLAKSKAKSKPTPSKPTKKLAVAEVYGDKLTFNHAMIYVKDVERSLAFYRDMLGFKLVDDYKFDGHPIYARLRAPGGDGTIALHMAGPGTPMSSEGVRLYFEIREVDDFCRRLQARGFFINQMPRVTPWGWRHAYMNDPDGHEISIYWAGEARMQRTVMKAAKVVEKTPPAKN